MGRCPGTPSSPTCAAHTRVLLNPEDPAALLDAVRSAAAAATDTLLFYFEATGSAA